MTLKKLAELIGVIYDGEDFEISGLNTLKDAMHSEVSFLENQKYLNDFVIRL